MARPFRFQPPALPAGGLVRPRLSAQLRRRRDRRLITVVAGPGFGKTSLLAGAFEGRDRAAPGSEELLAPGHDVWLSCEPGDVDASHLGRGLREAAGLTVPGGADGTVEELCQWVWAQAPRHVSFFLDDLHHVAASSEGAALVGRLLDELPQNGHLVLASRTRVPVATGRVAASGQLVRLEERDLVLDEDELAAFASANGIEPSLLSSTGGWPALVALTASAGADLVFDYLWEEILTRITPDRAKLLARFAMVGGGDDGVVSALAGEPARVADLVELLPLVERSATGAAALHPLWGPPLRPLLDDEEWRAALRAAAGVHRARQRYGDAVDLLVEADAWEDVLDVMREAQIVQLSVHASGDEFGRWYAALPPRWRHRPEALLAVALEQHRRAPMATVAVLEQATAGFRGRSDVDGEAAAIAIHGLVLWWAADLGGLTVLHQRVVELAAEGSELARLLQSIGLAAVAHLGGDSRAVLRELEPLDTVAAGPWRPVVHWFRGAAHRREGDLEKAIAELDALDDVDLAGMATQIHVVRLRTEWLQGHLDDALRSLTDVRDAFDRDGDEFNRRGSVLELAWRTAWLGDAVGAQDLLDADPVAIPDGASPLVKVTELLTRASIAVGRGDEVGAAEVLGDYALATVSAPEGWYWHDRAAVALLYVLVPGSRDHWTEAPLGAAHRIGCQLGRALVAARAGDLEPAADLAWPEPGVVRAHLPAPWVVELVAAGAAAGNPAPPGLCDAVGPHLREDLRRLAAVGTAHPALRQAAERLVRDLPAQPGSPLRIGVLGPLEVGHGADASTAPDLRRRRVRELLCFLVAHRRVQREQVVDVLWPDLADGGRNLRVTMSYLQRVLQPDRGAGEAAYFLRSEGPWLTLEPRQHLEVDAWTLDAELDAAARTGTPAAALDAYRRVAPLWRGDPHADVPYSDWALSERTRLRDRYRDAALRACELLLATGASAEARRAARSAIGADVTDERAYRLLVRGHLTDDDHHGARQALEECRTALAVIGLEPSPGTLGLVGEAAGPQRSGAGPSH